MATPDPQPKRVEITISTRTLVTVLGVLALAWAFIEARQAVLWVFVALFLAIVLSTPVTWLEERGMKRSTAASLLVLVLVVFLVFGLLAYLLVSPFVGAVRNLIEDLPQIVERIRESDVFRQIDARTDLGDRSSQTGPRSSPSISPRSSATRSSSAARCSASGWGQCRSAS